MSLADAAALVADGNVVVGGGCCYSRTPWAMLLELLRAGRRDLTLARNLMCYEAELFLARGAASKLMSSWVGIGLRWGFPRCSASSSSAIPPSTRSGATSRS